MLCGSKWDNNTIKETFIRLYQPAYMSFSVNRYGRVAATLFVNDVAKTTVKMNAVEVV